jgi:hypothetical protein
MLSHRRLDPGSLLLSDPVLDEVANHLVEDPGAPERVGPRNSVRVALIEVRSLSGAGCSFVSGWPSKSSLRGRLRTDVRQGPAVQLAAGVLDSQQVLLCGEFVFVE